MIRTNELRGMIVKNELSRFKHAPGRQTNGLEEKN